MTSRFWSVHHLVFVGWSLAACASAGSRGLLATAGVPAAEVPARDAGVTGGAAGPAGHVRGGTSPGGVVLGREGRGPEADFEAARAHFDRGETAAARLALESFVQLHPDHP